MYEITLEESKKLIAFMVENYLLSESDAKAIQDVDLDVEKVSSLLDNPTDIEYDSENKKTKKLIILFN